MQLKVHVPAASTTRMSTAEREVVVGSFRDIVRIANAVSGEVREWLRQVPMTPGQKSRTFQITAEWVEEQPKPAKPAPAAAASAAPKRKRKGKA